MGGCHMGGCHIGGCGCRCGGCHGCGRFFRGCVGCAGCGGCGGTCWVWTPALGWIYSCWAQSSPAANKPPDASEQIEQTVDTTGTVEAP
jgi:hypothetical protein